MAVPLELRLVTYFKLNVFAFLMSHMKCVSGSRNFGNSLTVNSSENGPVVNTIPNERDTYMYDVKNKGTLFGVETVL